MDFDKILELIRAMNRESVEDIQLYEMKRNTLRLKDKADCASLNEKFQLEES